MRTSAICLWVSIVLGARAAAAAPTVAVVGPMTPVDLSLLARAAFGTPLALSTVWNGKEFFAVWNDWRDPQQSNIFGARVQSGGAVVDQTSIPITPGWKPVIAYDGTNYLLVHGETLHADTLLPDLVARRLGPDGKLLDSQKIVLSTSAEAPYAVLWTGSEYAVFWDDDPPSHARQGTMARIGRDGSLIATQLPIWSPGALVNSASLSMGVAWGGSSFLVAKPSAGPVVQLISSEGKQVGAPFLVTTTTKSTQEPTVASDGSNFLVAWNDNDRGSGVKGVRVSPTGQIVDSTPLVLSSVTRADEAHMIWAGTEYVFDFLGSGTSATQLLRMSSAGVPLDAKPVVTAANQGLSTRMAASPDRLLLIDPRASSSVGNWLKLDGSATSEAPIPLCAAANRQTWPSVASNGSRYLAIWYDDRTLERPQVRGQIFDGTGKSVLADSFLITEAADLATEPYEVDGAGGRLAVASDGKDFLVAWTETDLNLGYSNVRAARVSGDGQVLDPAGITVGTGNREKNPVVVWTGKSYFVTYLMTYDGTYVGGKRVDSQGTILDASNVRLGSGDYNTDYAMRFTAVWGQDLLVITQRAEASLAAGRFDATGKLLGNGIFSLGRTANDPQQHVSAAWNGSEYLAVWSQYEPGATQPGLVAARLAPDGSFLDTANLQVAKADGAQDGAAVAWDGNNFVIVWFDHRVVSSSQERWTAFLARVDASGTLLDPGGVRISNPDEYGDHPTVVGRGGGDGLLALQHYDPAEDRRALRVVTRAFTDQALAGPGAPCVDGAACRSSFCVDGVCCDTACGGGNAGDCQACSVAAQAAKDGTCGPVAAGTVCRAAAGACDRAELCDGTSLLCPADQGVDGGCVEPARDAAVVDVVVEPAPDAAVADAPSGPETPPVEPARDAAVAPEVGSPDLAEDRPVDQLVDRPIADAFVGPDLAPDLPPPADARAPAPAGKSGCGCRIGGAGGDRYGAAVVLLMLALVLARRRGPSIRLE